MRNRTPTFAVLTVLVALAAACATVAPGSDPLLVNAERSLSVATGSLDTLFKADAKDGPVIDQQLPNWKPAVNTLRVQAPPILTAANAAIKAYRAALALYRTDPTKVTQEQLNALASDLGTKITAAVQLGQKAAQVAASWKGGA